MRLHRCSRIRRSQLGGKASVLASTLNTGAALRNLNGAALRKDKGITYGLRRRDNDSYEEMGWYANIRRPIATIGAVRPDYMSEIPTGKLYRGPSRTERDARCEIILGCINTRKYKTI